MDINTDWDPTTYFKELISRNKLAQAHGFDFVSVPNVFGAMMLASERTKSLAHVAFCETSDGSAVQGQSAGFFRRKVFTVFLLYRYDIKDEAQRMTRLNICRTLRDQIYSRFIRDSEELEAATSYALQTSIQERDTPTFTLDGCTGTWFQMQVDVPVDLRYNPDLWT